MKSIEPEEFFDLVWPANLFTQETLEIRALKRGEKDKKRKFCTSIPEFMQAVKEFGGEGWELYFGVSTRHGEDGTKRGCYRTRCLWADLDKGKLPDDMDPCPSMIVSSGKGHHLYWRLKSSAHVGMEKWGEVEAINRGLAKRFEGDDSIDISRILRIPGTYNYKYSSPRKVKAFINSDKEYTLDELRHLAIQKPQRAPCQFDGGNPIRNANIPLPIWKMLDSEGGTMCHGDESSQDYLIISSLLEAEYSPEDIYETFKRSTRGKSLEVRKPGHADDYLERTIEKAYGALKDRQDKAKRITVDFSGKDNILKPWVRASEIAPKNVKWLWDGYVPAGEITVLAGDPDMSKSTIAFDLVSRFSRGTAMPNGKRGIICSSVIVSVEDSPEKTLVPRLMAANADLDKVAIVQQTPYFPKDLDKVEQIVSMTGSRLVIVDPITAVLERETDSHKEADMRRFLQPFRDMAEKFDLSFIFIAHLRKDRQGSFLDRVSGTRGLSACARSGLGVRIVDNKHILGVFKNNLAPRHKMCTVYNPKQKNLTRTNGEWRGDENHLETVRIDWLEEIEFDFNSTEDAISDRMLDTASSISFLRGILEESEDGIDPDEIRSQAQGCGLNWREIKAARHSLKVKIVKYRGNWLWRLP